VVAAPAAASFVTALLPLPEKNLILEVCERAVAGLAHVAHGATDSTKTDATHQEPAAAASDAPTDSGSAPEKNLILEVCERAVVGLAHVAHGAADSTKTEATHQGSAAAASDAPGSAAAASDAPTVTTDSGSAPEKNLILEVCERAVAGLAHVAHDSTKTEATHQEPAAAASDAPTDSGSAPEKNLILEVCERAVAGLAHVAHGASCSAHH
jgi:hypothetical protein